MLVIDRREESNIMVAILAREPTTPKGDASPGGRNSSFGENFAMDDVPLIVSPSEKVLHEKLGMHGVGLALFSPIHGELHWPVGRQDQEENDDGSCLSSRDGYPVLIDYPCPSIVSDEEEDEDDVPPILIELQTDPSELDYAPPIISNELLQHIVEDALPSSLQICATWKRLFSISVHGDCVSTMMDRCGHFRHTLLVVRTVEGTILGGFASEPWKPRACFDQCQYYGNGHSFLFSTFPPRQDGKLNVYKWVGANDYCQLCDIQCGRIALGGGGNFGLVLQENFTRGSSGPCATFENSCLVPGNGSFNIFEFEVYGIVPLTQTAHFR